MTSRSYPAPDRLLPERLLMTDPARTPDVAQWMERLPSGTGIIFRHYGVPGREALAKELAGRALALDQPFLVAGDVVLAIRCGAAGVHLPEWALQHPPTQSLLASLPLVTAAAHSLGAVLRAAVIGCDAALLGPVFATPSHPDAQPLGRQRARAIVRQSPIPIYALGGMNESRWHALRGEGFVGYAGIGAFAPLDVGR